ncbi:MAG: ice-binding family protein, partial [Methanocalculus sp.]|uniref:ice-binding family protein n=1 Tax=Methanocalculus sp. TaxID=2004547 RepID=UPI002717CEF2
ILTMTNIAVKTGATVNGRLLAQTAVTLEQNTVTIPSTTLVVSDVVVNGTQNISIPGSGQPAVTENYTATVLDQFGNTMTWEEVTWALQAPVNGVSINQTGEVTVANADTTSAGTFTVVATSMTDIMVNGTLNVILSDVTLDVTQVTINGTQTIPIPGSGQPAVTKIYTAAVIDQFGNTMPGEAVTWALQAPVAGVTINEMTGNVTVANADTTSAGSFTVVATSVTNAGVSGTLNVILSDVPLDVTQVTVAGTQTVPIPGSGQPSVTKLYTAAVIDQFGNTMPAEAVTWALQAPVAGVSINLAGGVTIANADTTSAGSFTVVATSVTNVGVSGTLNVILSDVPLAVTQVTVAGTQTVPIPGSGQPSVTKLYTVAVIDQFGNTMPAEGVTWSLQTPVTGVSINLAGGVTIANADTTNAGSFTVVATSTTNVGVIGTLKVILSDVPLDVTQVTVAGTQTVPIPGSGQPAVTKIYTAAVIDQFGNTMPGEAVTWALQTPVAGVSINLAGGVTIANTDITNPGSFTVVATSVTDGTITGTRQVILSDVPLGVTQVTVTGTQTVPIPESGQPAVTKIYTAAVIDQFGNIMPGEAVTWALQTPVAGVSINLAGGVTVANADITNAGSFTVVATSATNTTITGTLKVILSDVSVDSVDLGTAGNYVVLAKTAISTVPESKITGNIAVSPAAATFITGFSLTLDSSGKWSTSPQVSGNVYAADYATPTPTILTIAVSDMETAYTDAAGRTPDYIELHTGDISGKTLTPGVYKWGTDVTINNDVTLDAEGNPNAVWIFQIAKTLNIAANKQVILSNGAQAKNIFWVVAGTTTLNTGAVLNGNVLGGPGASTIALQSGSVLHGKALGQTDVTFIASTVTDPATITPSPIFASITPSSGPTTGMSNVLITGTDFTGAVSVTFGNVAATNVQVISPTQITATTPAHPAGTVDIVITTPFGIATAPSAYTYVAYSGGGGGGSSTPLPVEEVRTVTLLKNSLGQLLQSYTVESPSGVAKLYLDINTIALDKNGNPLGWITIEDVSRADLPAVPNGANFSFTGYAVDCTPDGATFAPPIRLVFTFTQTQWNTLMWQADQNPDLLVVKWYNEDTRIWENIPTKWNYNERTVTATISHFSVFALFVDTDAPGVVTTPTPVMTQTTPPITPVATPVSQTLPIKPEPVEFQWIYILLILGVIIAVTGAAYYYTKKRW